MENYYLVVQDNGDKIRGVFEKEGDARSVAHYLADKTRQFHAVYEWKKNSSSSQTGDFLQRHSPSMYRWHPGLLAGSEGSCYLVIDTVCENLTSLNGVFETRENAELFAEKMITTHKVKDTPINVILDDMSAHRECPSCLQYRGRVNALNNILTELQNEHATLVTAHKAAVDRIHELERDQNTAIVRKELRSLRSKNTKAQQQKIQLEEQYFTIERRYSDLVAGLVELLRKAQANDASDDDSDD